MSGNFISNSSNFSMKLHNEDTNSNVNLVLILAGFTFYLLAFLTAVGNALVLHAIRTEKRLQTVSNLFIMSLATADLTVGLIVMPISAAYFVAGEWRWGVVICQLWLAVDYTASTASIFNLVILSLDRYWSVSSPLRYIRKRTRKRALLLIGGSWLAASLWLIPLLAWHHIFYDGERQHPPHVCETEFSSSITLKIITSVLNFYGPSTLMVVLYCRIFRTIKTSASEMLGRVTPVESSSSQHVPNTGQCKETFRNLTIIALADTNVDSYPSTSFYKGISVQVECINGNYSPPKNSTSKEAYTTRLNQTSSIKDGHLCVNDNSTSRHSFRRHCSHKRNHQNHLACYSSPSFCTKESPSFQSVNDMERWGSFRSCRGIRDFLSSEKKGRNSTLNSSTNCSDRKPGTLNIAKEKKAARQLGVIMGAFFACWIPYFTLFPIIAFCDDCIPARVHLAAIWLGYLNSTLNPIIYPLCNQHFRRAFSRMLRCSRSSRHIPSVTFLPVPY